MQTALLNTLGLSAIVIAGVLGLYGLHHDYRDKNTGTLTKHGRRARWLLSTALAVGLISKGVEIRSDYKKQKSAIEEAAADAKRTAAIVGNLERLVTGFRQLTFSYRATFADSTAGGRTFIRATETALQSHFKEAEYIDGVTFASSSLLKWNNDPAWTRAVEVFLNSSPSLRAFPRDSVPNCPSSDTVKAQFTLTLGGPAELAVDQFFDISIESVNAAPWGPKRRLQSLSGIDFQRSAIVLFLPSDFRFSKSGDGVLDSNLGQFEAPARNSRAADPFLNAMRFSHLTAHFDDDREIEYAHSLRRVDPCTGIAYDVLLARSDDTDKSRPN